MKRILSALLLLAGMLWPFFLYWSLSSQSLSLPWLVLPLAALWLLRAAGRLVAFGERLAALGVLAFLLSVLVLEQRFAAFDPLLALRAYPVLVNALLLGVFLHSLLAGNTPLIERLARLRQRTLPAAGVAYTRRVTVIWCGFFAVNGSIAAALALFASWQSWTLYNGLISYLLMGALLLGEWCVRPQPDKPSKAGKACRS